MPVGWLGKGDEQLKARVKSSGNSGDRIMPDKSPFEVYPDLDRKRETLKKIREQVYLVT